MSHTAKVPHLRSPPLANSPAAVADENISPGALQSAVALRKSELLELRKQLGSKLDKVKEALSESLRSQEAATFASLDQKEQDFIECKIFAGKLLLKIADAPAKAVISHINSRELNEYRTFPSQDDLRLLNEGIKATEATMDYTTKFLHRPKKLLENLSRRLRMIVTHPIKCVSWAVGGIAVSSGVALFVPCLYPYMIAAGVIFLLYGGKKCVEAHLPQEYTKTEEERLGAFMTEPQISIRGIGQFQRDLQNVFQPLLGKEGIDEMCCCCCDSPMISCLHGTDAHGDDCAIAPYTCSHALCHKCAQGWPGPCPQCREPHGSA